MVSIALLLQQRPDVVKQRPLFIAPFRPRDGGLSPVPEIVAYDKKVPMKFPVKNSRPLEPSQAAHSRKDRQAEIRCQGGYRATPEKRLSAEPESGRITCGFYRKDLHRIGSAASSKIE